MVTNKPTTIVQIMSQSDIMRRTNSQNYKINRKIWEDIESRELNGDTEETPQDNELEARIAALEARAYDDSDVKAKMGYNSIPEGESLMSQIISLSNELEEQEYTMQEP